MTTNDPLRDAIRDYLTETGMAERELSLRAGVNEKAVNQILTGKSRNPRSDTVQALARAMGRSVATLMALPSGVSRGAQGLRSRPVKGGAEVEPPAPGMVRIAEFDVRPHAGGGGEITELDASGGHAVVAHWAMPGDYLRAFTASPEQVRIVRVAGDSMEPEYPAGERVAVDTSHRIPSPPGVYVLWDGFGLVLKRVELLMGEDPPLIRISSINPAYPPYERLLSEVHINGRVIGKWQWK
ncbi:XRE family transcriptional regulator [Falsiroseomonas selenitidurans]|uniref:Helix-turn-helix transcriptional regulator n=1 Tax=Falsiroseomonas selenitidurans TaxID=2716335 RepID=A0ABX1E0K1_9PROT|nr:XRE family transcriptional regulator [Falsiroseomonas selenitidurans]NKC30180.1 helix-turn-helix transcriptional regulator [Falsiroseomonas selenitidurans]